MKFLTESQPSLFAIEAAIYLGPIRGIDKLPPEPSTDERQNERAVDGAANNAED